jgi:hypothetical protein
MPKEAERLGERSCRATTGRKAWGWEPLNDSDVQAVRQTRIYRMRCNGQQENAEPEQHSEFRMLKFDLHVNEIESMETEKQNIVRHLPLECQLRGSNYIIVIARSRSITSRNDRYLAARASGQIREFNASRFGGARQTWADDP